MKLIAILLAVAAALAAMPTFLTGCGEGTMDTVRGSGVVEIRNLNYSGFTRVENGSFVRQSTSFDINISYSNEFSVSVTMDDNLFEYLEISRSGNRLKISMDGDTRYSYADILVEITMPEVDGVDFSGAVSGSLSGFTSQRPLEIRMSGASDITVDDMVAGDLALDISGASSLKGTAYIEDGDFEISGASIITLRGSGDLIVADVSGASGLRTGNFNAANMDVRLSGASNGVIYTTGTLDVDLSGASHLDYTGDPTLGDVKTTDSSTLSKN